VLLTGFGLVAWRLPLLRSPARLDALLTRDAAIIGNNVLLLALTGIILLGTILPLVVEAVTGDQISVGRPYFEDAVAPVALLLLLLLATGPLLPWRTADPSRTLVRLRWPVVAGALVMAGCAVAGARSPGVVAGFGLTAAVVVGNGRELLAGMRRGGGRRGRLRRGAPRYGGLLVHVGLAVLAAGVIASAALGAQAELTLGKGETGTFAGYTVRYDGMTTTEQPQRTVLTEGLTVTRSGEERSLGPRLNLYPAASEPIGTPAIDRGPVWDLYASTLALQDDGRTATFRLYHTPGVSWIWLGALVMALGGVLAAWPQRRSRRRTPTVSLGSPTSSADDRTLVGSEP
jgi:cytochrome c-type biogenesis protein CcmF